MKRKMFCAVSTVLFFAIITGDPALSSSCKCEFDSDAYEATGFFTGACSYTMDSTRKKCTIHEAGNYSDVKKSLVREDQFGNPAMLMGEFSSVIQALSENRYVQPNVDPQKFFPFLLRPSYLAAPFLEDYQKRIIDDILLHILRRNGKEMLTIFWGFAGKKTFRERELIKEKHEMEIAKGSVRLIVDFSGRGILVCARL
jgi:hypothetical protein